MAVRGKDGNWQFDDEDEQRIAIFTESNIRAAKALEKQKHGEPWDGKADRRKNDRRKAATPTKKKKGFWDN